jgi:hypothetical protein
MISSPTTWELALTTAEPVVTAAGGTDVAFAGAASRRTPAPTTLPFREETVRVPLRTAELAVGLAAFVVFGRAERGAGVGSPAKPDPVRATSSIRTTIERFTTGSSILEKGILVSDQADQRCIDGKCFSITLAIEPEETESST